MMRYGTLGRSGLRVSRAVLGAMTFGEQGGVGASLPESRRILDTYLTAGGNTIDTASNYRDGASEEFLGELLDGRRERVVLMSKYTVTSDLGDPNAGGSSRRNLRASLERSLTRMRTDHLDLLWVHIWDPHTPLEETMRALDDAVRAGKVLYVGVSDTPAWVVARANTLAELSGWSPFVALQLPYSLLARDAERDLLPLADHLGLGVLAWSPLAGGRLTGKYATPAEDGGTAGRLAGQAPTDRESAVVDAVREAATGRRATPAQVALAWVLARTPTVLPILGARSAEQLEDNLAALDLQLDTETLDRLDSVSAVELGFPHDFIASTRGWVLGAADVTDHF